MRRNNPASRSAFDLALEQSRADREAREAYQDRARRIALNPYNLPGIEGAPQMANFELWAARFEREGRDAPRGLPCPYAKGSMAAHRWACGHFDAPPAAGRG
jgi:hypothetical protein